jgi:hypothetical protein
MNSPETEKAGWKKKLRDEMAEYAMNVCYLTVVFSAFVEYRRLLLASQNIPYTNYFVAVIEAVILAKVILIGDVLHLGRGLEKKPLIFPTLYRTVVFTLFVGAFTIVEHAIRGLLHGKGLSGGVEEFFAKGPYELLANCLVVFVALIPFFAIKELERVFGDKRIAALFFRARTDQPS